MTDDNVIGLPVPEPEAYVTRQELARIMGVSVRTIDYFVSLGMPAETWGIRCRRFQPSRALAWARARARDTKAA
jgi:phage terminase Nu1 subunit (DNA packaging protein)